MLQIHHVQVTYEDRWVLDPQYGSVKKREEILAPSGTSSIGVPAKQFDSCPDGETFEVQTDGAFHVPNDVAAYFLRMPGWREGPSPLAVEPEPTPARKTKAKATEDNPKPTE
jgi:hypothetical protein